MTKKLIILLFYDDNTTLIVGVLLLEEMQAPTDLDCLKDLCDIVVVKIQQDFNWERG